MTKDEIPPLLPPHQMPPVIDQAGLHRTWRALMGELGFDSSQLWVLFVGPGGQPLGVTSVERLPRLPQPEEVRSMAEMFAQVGEDLSFAFLYARPGTGPRTAEDLAWAHALSRVSQGTGAGAWPVHLADDDSITVVAPDDLAEAG